MAPAYVAGAEGFRGLAVGKKHAAGFFRDAAGCWVRLAQGWKSCLGTRLFLRVSPPTPSLLSPAGRRGEGNGREGRRRKAGKGWRRGAMATPIANCNPFRKSGRRVPRSRLPRTECLVNRLICRTTGSICAIDRRLVWCVFKGDLYIPM